MRAGAQRPLFEHLYFCFGSIRGVQTGQLPAIPQPAIGLLRQFPDILHGGSIDARSVAHQGEWCPEERMAVILDVGVHDA